MDKYLVLSALGTDRPGIVKELSEVILECGCNIESSRMTVLGGEFAVMLMVCGQWNNIAKLEDSIAKLETTLQLKIITKRTEPVAHSENQLPYAVEAICVDHKGIVHDISEFFSTREINIQEITSSHYHAPHTGTPMFSIQMIVDVPEKLRISRLREEFLEYADKLNIDAILEPYKG